MTPAELALKLCFTKHWRAWPYYDSFTGELQYYTVECRIDKTKYTPEMIYRQRLNPYELSQAYGADDMSFLKPLIHEMTARLDKGLEDYVASL